VKSTFSAILRALLDPNTAPLRDLTSAPQKRLWQQFFRVIDRSDVNAGI
jgi:hypothetical protein